MTGDLGQSSFVAALFALHPINVESVAWVAERKNVLSTFFWMLTMWSYVRYIEQPELKRYLLVVLIFALVAENIPRYPAAAEDSDSRRLFRGALRSAHAAPGRPR